ncbi:copper amine oxidase [Paenibacillus lemnae]|uniref:Copper amine oxidase n=2 Tax=Paenibacillus lemnae TaxID=1330551 RepID=A0A848M4H7_PAELE|nr:copper amine oxidase [Paenibacillus lemnae]
MKLKLGWKKITAAALVLTLMSGGTLLFADSIQDRIRVWMNGQELKDGAYLIDNKIYVPVRDISGATNWNKSSGTLRIVKPNVHIFLFKGDTAFGNVNRGKLKFNVFSQVDTLHDDVEAVKVAIEDPGGSIKDIQSQSNIQGKDNFWFRTYDFTYDFDTVGKYSVGFYIKTSAGSGFEKVAEKVITVLK